MNTFILIHTKRSSRDIDAKMHYGIMSYTRDENTTHEFDFFLGLPTVFTKLEMAILDAFFNNTIDVADFYLNSAFHNEFNLYIFHVQLNLFRRNVRGKQCRKVSRTYAMSFIVVCLSSLQLLNGLMNDFFLSRFKLFAELLWSVQNDYIADINLSDFGLISTTASN